jgi:hypothetical protein
MYIHSSFLTENVFIIYLQEWNFESNNIKNNYTKSHSVEKGFKTVWKTCQWFDDFWWTFE